MATSHSLLLSNSFCLEEYPSNQGCEFTNQLNQPLDVSYGKWAANLSEIIYEPNFWSNIRKPYTFFDVAVGNYTHTKLFTRFMIFRDLRVRLIKEIEIKKMVDFKNPITFMAEITMFTKNSPADSDDKV